MSRLSVRRAGDPRAESAGAWARSPPLEAGEQCSQCPATGIIVRQNAAEFFLWARPTAVIKPPLIAIA